MPELKKRATEAGKRREFVEAHNEILLALRDFEAAFTKAELLFQTKKAGGEVRLWVNRVIAVCFALFREEKAGWILKYKGVPESWPD